MSKLSAARVKTAASAGSSRRAGTPALPRRASPKAVLAKKPAAKAGGKKPVSSSKSTAGKSTTAKPAAAKKPLVGKKPAPAKKPLVAKKVAPAKKPVPAKKPLASKKPAPAKAPKSIKATAPAKGAPRPVARPAQAAKPAAKVAAKAPAKPSAKVVGSKTAAKPAVAKPAVAKPVVAKPVVAKPGAAKPGAAKPAAAKPGAAKPGAAKPAAAKPLAKAPAASAPAAKAPVAAKAAPVAKPATTPVAPQKPVATRPGAVVGKPAIAPPKAPVTGAKPAVAGAKPAARPTVVQPPAPKVKPEDALLERAQSAINKGEDDAAEKLLEQMIGQFPDDPRGRIFLGNLRRRKGDEAGALEEYARILKKNPQEPLALWYKADLYLAKKPNPDFAQAVAAYKKIVAAHGRKKDDRSKKFVDEAKKQLRFCDARKLSLQSREYVTKKDDVRALKKGRELLEKARSIYPEDARNHMNLGVAYLLLGDHDKAVKLCQEAITINPRYARAYLMLGRAYRKQQSFRQAKDALLKCIELDRQGPDARDAWNDRREVEREIARVRNVLFLALSGRPDPQGQPVRLTFAQMKRMITMLEGDEITGADLVEDARGTYALSAYSERHRYRLYPGPESLVVERDGQAI